MKTEKYYNGNAIKIKKAFLKLGADNVEVNKCYNYHMGFATFGDKMCYFNTGDYRGMDGQMLIRTAEHNRDFTGGSNNYVTNNIELFEGQLSRFVNSYITLWQK